MKTILLLSTHPWGKMMLSKMHFADALSDMGHRVFFVDPPRKEVARISQERLTSEKNITVIHLPEHAWRVVAREKCYLLFRQIEKKYVRQIRKITGDIDELWCFNPHLIADLDLFGASKALLFVYDLYRGKSMQIAARKSDGIISIAQNILDEFASIDKPKLLLQHGLAAAFEKQARKNDFSYVKSDRIKVGYVGNLLRGAIDFPMLQQIITLHPEMIFYFWGPSEKKENNVTLRVASEEAAHFHSFLSERNNVVLHGIKPPEQLAEEIQEMDAFLFLYDAKRDMNGASNSHKLMEYLSTGKAVISSFVSSYEGKGLLVMDEKGSTEFASFFDEKMKRLEELNSVELKQRRIDFALNNTYGKQIERVRRFVGTAL